MTFESNIIFYLFPLFFPITQFRANTEIWWDGDGIDDRWNTWRVNLIFWCTWIILCILPVTCSCNVELKYVLDKFGHAWSKLRDENDYFLCLDYQFIILLNLYRHLCPKEVKFVKRWSDYLKNTNRKPHFLFGSGKS